MLSSCAPIVLSARPAAKPAIAALASVRGHVLRAFASHENAGLILSNRKGTDTKSANQKCAFHNCVFWREIQKLSIYESTWLK
jgi:hypothetical protein